MIVRIIIAIAVLSTAYSQTYNPELGANLCHLAVASYCRP